MNEQAAHLVDRVLPHVPYRQWVLTLPGELARVVAFDADLATAVFGVFAEELARWQRERANDLGIADPQTGCLLEIQRFADGARTAAGLGAQRPSRHRARRGLRRRLRWAERALHPAGPAER